MKVTERKLGRMFTLSFADEEDFYATLVRFVKEKRIRAGLVLFLGAFYECDVIPGVMAPSPPMPPYDQTRKHLGDWRDVHGHGLISWPDAPPVTLLPRHHWKGEPEPYIHLHMTLSGGPGKLEEVYAGHLCDGRVKGMTADIFEYV